MAEQAHFSRLPSSICHVSCVTTIAPTRTVSLTLIRNHIRAAWFNTNWQFSNGCTFEFAVSLDADLPTFDHHGHALLLDPGVELIEQALIELTPAGFDVSKLQRNLDYLLTSSKARLHPIS